MSYSELLPEGITKELEANIVEWLDSISVAAKGRLPASQAFESLFFDDFFSGLSDELKEEVNEARLVHRLTEASLELMFPKYLAVIERRLVDILAIKGLNYHDSKLVSSNHDIELIVVRVLGGLLYQSYYHHHGYEKHSLSTNYVPCSYEEISSMCRQMVIECIDSYKPYLPSDKFNHLRVNALTSDIKDSNYVERVTDVF